LVLVVLWSSVIDWLVDLLDFIVILGILDFLFSCVGRRVSGYDGVWFA